MEEKAEAEQKAKDAKTAHSSAESKVSEEQTEIDKLDQRITAKEAMLDGLVTEQQRYASRSTQWIRMIAGKNRSWLISPVRLWQLTRTSPSASTPSRTMLVPESDAVVAVMEISFGTRKLSQSRK